MQVLSHFKGCSEIGDLTASLGLAAVGMADFE
jgi:hypothetical protein